MSKTYFSTLNYSLANEDTTLEVRMVEKLKPKRIMSVCGSGGRALPLLAAGAESLTCVDLADEQLHLAELRRATFQDLSHRDFLLFWGYPPYSVENGYLEREKLFRGLDLGETAGKWADQYLSAKGWQSPLYDGKWERTFATIAKILQTLFGSDYGAIFECRSIEEQTNFFKGQFPRLRWNLLVRALGNRAFFNALLYKGHFVKKNIPDTHYAFYQSAFERIFTTTPIRENFFIQLAFFGRVRFDEGIPIEARATTFQAIQRSLKGESKVVYVRADITELLSAPEAAARPFDFLSFSDVPSYFSGDLEREFMQRVRPGLRSGAHVVLRHYMRVPEAMDLRGYREVTDAWRREIDREYTQMYKIQVLEVI